MNNTVKFVVWDKCNLNCEECHWFSSPVKTINKVKGSNILSFINKWSPKRVCFTGGEPTLWPFLADTVNKIPTNVHVDVNTNGMRPDIISRIQRNIILRLSIHKKTNLMKFKKCEMIAKKKGFTIKYSTFDLPKNPLNVKANPNQMSVSKNDPRIGKKVICRPTTICFGSDERAYICEIGLRSKSDDYFAGL